MNHRSPQEKMQKLARRDRDRGMTIIEIMIVLTLLGLIAAAIGVGVSSNLKKGRIKIAQGQANDIAGKIVLYMSDNSSECPKGVDDLVAQKFLPKKPKDPWGREYILRCPGQVNTDSADVISLGPDGQEGTADDIKAQEQ